MLSFLLQTLWDGIANLHFVSIRPDGFITFVTLNGINVINVCGGT